MSTLFQIASAATEENAVILLNPNDNVAIARVPLSPGQRITAGQADLASSDSVLPGHKIALKDIRAGEPIRRYGEIIGLARYDIAAGQHIHEHNLVYQELDPTFEGAAPTPTSIASTRSFKGYQREDGRIGTRNYIAVVAASNCAAHTVSLIERHFEGRTLPPNVDGVVSFPHGDGCAQTIGPDTQQLQRTLEGVLDHPNVAAAVILGLGCEVNQIDHYLGRKSQYSSKNLVGLTLQESGGTRRAVEQASRDIEQLLEQVAGLERTPVPASALVLGLNCGGSDSFSGITANPALGYCCDLIVREGGTVVLAETTEIFGAEHTLLRRAKDEQTARKLLDCIDYYKTYLRQFGGSFNDNPSPGNKKGGLTNIVEKSLGAVAKAGTTTLEDVVGYGERIRSHGFVFMNTPGYDPASLAGLAAGGVNLIAFTTGRGSAIGFPTIPTLKISSNSDTFRRMPDNMDINAGTIADGTATVEEVGVEIFESLLRVASGEKTKAEILGHHEFVPWKIGPVL
ncbi:MAG: UxaA family hydrolase [Bryobacteraceae bacterium]